MGSQQTLVSKPNTAKVIPPKPIEKKHSHNPLKFFRAASHHQEDTDDKKKPHFSLRSRSNTLKSELNTPSISTSPSIHSINDVKRGNMANPFLKNAATFDVLGTGADIAAPRNSTTSHNNPTQNPVSLSRAASFSHNLNNNKGHNKPIYNPYGINSRSPSNYSINGSNEDEKNRLLSTPIKDPNDLLPLDLKQEFYSLNDAFIFPDKQKKKLGDGASATVFLVQHKKTFKNYALKKFTLLPHETDDEFYKRATKEFVIAKRLAHNKHIVTTYYCLRIQTTTNITRGWGFILDYCQGGDLFSLITRPGWKSYSIIEKYCIFKQLVLGVQFIHSKGIVHRDLKPENVLIDVTGLVKLTDFGIAEYVHEDENDLTSPIKKFTNFVGSPPYVPPELMNIRKTHTGEYDPYKLDMWGIGVILFVMIYQNAPFRSACSTDTMFRDFVSSYKTYIGANPSFRFGDVNHGPGIEFKYAKEFQSPGASRVAWRLCDYDPEHRYTMDAVLKDPWFAQLECCFDDDEEFENDPIFSNHESVDSLPSALPSAIPSAAPSPSINAKSMLDFEPSPIKETPELNIAEPMLISASQTGLPPVAEDHDESDFSSQPSDPITSPQSMCDLTYTVQPIPVSPLNHPINSFNSDLNFDGLKINAEVFPQPTSATTPISSPIQPDLNSGSGPLSLPKVSTPSSHNGFQRAASFSSVLSSRSVRSTRSTGSTSEYTSGVVTPSLNGKKKIKHHHLDVSNVSNHGTVKR